MDFTFRRILSAKGVGEGVVDVEAILLEMESTVCVRK